MKKYTSPKIDRLTGPRQNKGYTGQWMVWRGND